MASEVVKIKVAQQIALKKEVEAHTFVFHEGLNQLKSDIGKIWFFGYNDADVELTDLKKYLELFSGSSFFQAVYKCSLSYCSLFCRIADAKEI